MKKLYVGTNTKMYKTPSAAVEHVLKLRELTRDIARQLELFVIPSYTSIAPCVQAVGEDILIGAQNMGWEDEGQYTGEISAPMLEEVGVRLVMIGHSERRHVLHETDEEEQKKIACAARHDFKILLCVGETAQQKSYEISRETLAQQLKIGLHGLDAEIALHRLWIAYEPVWAIGVNGVPADEHYASEMHRHIKAVLEELYGDQGREIPVLYGGSVNNENAVKLIAQPYIDGLFIGRSAWSAENFNQIIREILPVFRSRDLAEK